MIWLNYCSRKSRKLFIFPIVSIIISLLVWTFTPIDLFPSSFDSLLIAPVNSYDYLNRTQDWMFGEFVIKNEDHCSGKRSTSIVLLVHSDPGNSKNRNLLRQFTPLDYCLTFLLGSRDDGTNSEIEKESKQFGDIVQGTFHDSYRNLTRKHIMGLTWAALYCPFASFVFKVDDDIFLNYTFISDYLDSQFPPSQSDPFLVRSPIKMIIGYVMPQSPVIRDLTSKWFVHQSDYPNDYYPTFVSGWGYITTIDVVNQLLNQIPSTPMFWIDDIYVTGMLRSKISDIFFYSINKFFNINIDLLKNWTQLTYDHVWPYMVSVTSRDLLDRSLQRYQFCRNHKDHCYCCLPWLDLFNSKSSNSSIQQFVPLKSQGKISEIHMIIKS